MCLRAAAAGLSLSLILVAPAWGQGATNFGIDVPARVSPQLPLSRLKVTVTLTQDAAVAFNITNPHGVTRRFPASGTVSPGSTPVGQELCGMPCSPPPGATGTDFVTMIPPASGLAVGDPARKRYVFFVETLSDFDLTSFCASTMAGPEAWNLALDTPASGQFIISTCVESFDLGTPGNMCAMERRTPLTEPVAHVTGQGQPESFCGDARPAVDVTLVLDRSGSMSSPALGSAPRTKAAALRAAVEDFVTVWQDLPAPVSIATDRLGMVFFNQTARWHNDVGVGAWNTFADGPQSFSAVAPTVTAGNLGAVSSTGSTSIGDGLLEAATNFSGTDRRRAVLLMSDGKQNSGPQAAVDNVTSPTQVLTHPVGNPSATTPLPNQSTFSIYSVTVGTSTAVSPDINEDVAAATGGFYINSEDNAELIRPFFVEMLENFVRFNTYETVRIAPASVSRTAPYRTEFHVTSTTDRVLANVTSPTLMPLRVTLRPQGGNPVSARGTGRVRASIDRRRQAAPAGRWMLEVAVDDSVRPRVTSGPIEVVVLADDPILKTDLSVVPGDYAPGDRIRVRARIRAGGRPVTELGPGGRVIARVARPGQSLGAILVESPGQNVPGESQGDPSTAADARLAEILAENPEALERENEQVALRDDGGGADDVAGDGVYQGTLTAGEPGHYHFVIVAEGEAPRIGRFTREQARTVHVRSVPDASETSLVSAIDPSGNGGTLTLTMTPRTLTGSPMGPGWANYFWFRAPSGVRKARDLGDGRYQVAIPYTGSTPPQVQVHFIRTSSNITDEVRPEQLPVRLGQGTVLVPDALEHGEEREPPGTGAPCGGLSLPFSAGLGLVGVGAAFARRRREDED